MYQRGNDFFFFLWLVAAADVGFRCRVMFVRSSVCVVVLYKGILRVFLLFQSSVSVAMS